MNTCNTCIHNPVCDHNIHGFEDCGNYIDKDSIVEVPDEEDLKKILSYLCLHAASIMPGPDYIPSTLIAQVHGLEVKRVRKILKRLKKLGLVTSGGASYYSEYHEHFCIYSGFSITRKAMLTKEYRSAHEREREICRECWNIDIGELKL